MKNIKTSSFHEIGISPFISSQKDANCLKIRRRYNTLPTHVTSVIDSFHNEDTCMFIVSVFHNPQHCSTVHGGREVKSKSIFITEKEDES